MTSDSKPHNHTSYFFIFNFIFSIFSFKLSHCIQNHDIFCPEIEKQSLVNLKQSLKDPNNLLSSWDGEVDCCKWKGIICNNSTGHVHQLYLQNNPPFQGLIGQINPSMFNLKRLRFVDLSQNNFGQTIPSFIALFKYLDHLNLSDAEYHGKIPSTIENLSNLQTLSMSGHRNIVASDNLEWLSGLSQLQHLDMNFVNLIRASNWLQAINTLPFLLELHFQNCSVVFIAPLNGVNMSSLSSLDLSHNNFQSLSIPA